MIGRDVSPKRPTNSTDGSEIRPYLPNNICFVEMAAVVVCVGGVP